jgi:hypothetical protein
VFTIYAPEILKVSNIGQKCGAQWCIIRSGGIENNSGVLYAKGENTMSATYLQDGIQATKAAFLAAVVRGDAVVIVDFDCHRRP